MNHRILFLCFGVVSRTSYYIDERAVFPGREGDIPRDTSPVWAHIGVERHVSCSQLLFLEYPFTPRSAMTIDGHRANSVCCEPSERLMCGRVRETQEGRRTKTRGKPLDF